MSKIYKSGEIIDQAQPFSLIPVRSSEVERLDGLFDIEKKAYERGFEAGKKRARELGQEELKRLTARLLSILDKLLVFKDKFYQDKEKELVELVLSVAKKVIHAELSINRDVIVNVLRAALGVMTSKEEVRISLNPEDLDYLKNSKTDLWDNLEEVKGFSLEGDSSVKKGGCIITSNHGKVDARIEEGFKVIEAAMKESF